MSDIDESNKLSPEELLKETLRKRKEATYDGHFFRTMFLIIFLILNLLKTGEIDPQTISILMIGEAGISYHHYKINKNKQNFATFVSWLFIAIVAALFYFFP